MGWVETNVSLGAGSPDLTCFRSQVEGSRQNWALKPGPLAPSL